MRWFGWVLGLLVSVPALAQQGEPSEDGGVAEEAPVTQTVVTASRSVERLQDTPVAVEVITRRDIEATGARELAEALGARPGLELRRGFAGTELRVQGLSPEYTLVLVDGERVTGRLGGALDFSRFSTEDIEQVEIIRGPSSVLYGSDAVAGVVNIITRKAQRPLGATAQASLGGLWQFEADGSAELRGDVSDQRQSSALDQVEETREQMARVGLQLDQTLAQTHQLVVGVEAIGETLHSDRLSSPGQRGRLSLYGQDSWGG